jgi:hypothetical protein
MSYVQEQYMSKSMRPRAEQQSCELEQSTSSYIKYCNISSFTFRYYSCKVFKIHTILIHQHKLHSNQSPQHNLTHHPTSTMPKMKVTTTPDLPNNPLDAAFKATSRDFLAKLDKICDPLEKRSATFSAAKVFDQLRVLKNEFAQNIIDNMETVAGFLKESRKKDVLKKMMLMISVRVEKKLVWMLESEREENSEKSEERGFGQVSQ